MHFWATKNIQSLKKEGMSHVFRKPSTRDFPKNATSQPSMLIEKI
jgi:hypothetical protein